MGYRTARVFERCNGHCGIRGHVLLLLYVRPRQSVLLVVTPLGNTELSTFIHMDVVAHSIYRCSAKLWNGFVCPSLELIRAARIARIILLLRGAVGSNKGKLG